MTRKLEERGVADGGRKTDKWDFTGAQELVLWCNGLLAGGYPARLKGLLAAGYPASKLIYYRGGMQTWQLFGLTTVISEG
ncbi:MAG: hypothetical protein G8D58_10055 [gamma proteobacterium symbiont of Phacoides pectinatus]